MNLLIQSASENQLSVPSTQYQQELLATSTGNWVLLSDCHSRPRAARHRKNWTP